MKQWVPITSKSSKFKGASQYYVVKLPKSAGARHYCPKIQRVPGNLSTRANSSPVNNNLTLKEFHKSWWFRQDLKLRPLLCISFTTESYEKVGHF